MKNKENGNTCSSLLSLPMLYSKSQCNITSNRPLFPLSFSYACFVGVKADFFGQELQEKMVIEVDLFSSVWVSLQINKREREREREGERESKCTSRFERGKIKIKKGEPVAFISSRYYTSGQEMEKQESRKRRMKRRRRKKEKKMREREAGKRERRNKADAREVSECDTHIIP